MVRGAGTLGLGPLGLLALACVVVAAGFTFRGVHVASALDVAPVLWSLRFARMRLPQRPEAEVAPSPAVR